jgi:hypothetical protein
VVVHVAGELEGEVGRFEVVHGWSIVLIMITVNSYYVYRITR